MIFLVCSQAWQTFHSPSWSLWCWEVSFCQKTFHISRIWKRKLFLWLCHSDSYWVISRYVKEQKSECYFLDGRSHNGTRIGYCPFRWWKLMTNTQLSAIIITGGDVYFNTSTQWNTVELLRSNGSYWCSLPDLPGPRLSHTQNGLIACGGRWTW